MSLELSLEVVDQQVHFADVHHFSDPVYPQQMQVTTLSDDRSKLSLPYDFLKLSTTPYHAGFIDFSFPRQLPIFVNLQLSPNGAAPSAFLLSTFVALLYRYSQQTLIDLDCTVLTHHTGDAPTVRLAATVSGERTIQSLVQQISDLLSDFQTLPIVSCHTPHSTVAFTYSQGISFSAHANTSEYETLDLPLSQVEQPDLHLQVLHDGLDVRGRLAYNVHLFQHSTIERLSGHLCQVIEGGMANLDRPISDLPLLTPAERHQFYKEWSSLSVCYPQQPIFAVIENHAAQRPEKKPFPLTVSI